MRRLLFIAVASLAACDESDLAGDRFAQACAEAHARFGSPELTGTQGPFSEAYELEAAVTDLRERAPDDPRAKEAIEVLVSDLERKAPLTKWTVLVAFTDAGQRSEALCEHIASEGELSFGERDATALKSKVGLQRLQRAVEKLTE